MFDSVVMSITNVSAATATTQVASVSRASRTHSSEAPKEGGGTKLSKMGELVGQLQELQASDPEKAKAVLSKIAEQLKAKADESGDDKMSALADKFASAAESGDLSALKPNGPPPGHPPEGVVGKLANYASYAKSGSEDPMQQIESILADALAG